MKVALDVAKPPKIPHKGGLLVVSVNYCFLATTAETTATSTETASAATTSAE